MNYSTVIIQDFVKKLKDALKEQFDQQGHTLTGKAMASVVVEYETSPEELSMEVSAPGYVPIVNKGVPSNKIPYSGRSGNGGTSMYIQALIDYAKRRMHAGDKEAKSIAFAIAATHKKEGMPTRGSYAFSNTGQRLGFVDQALEDISPDIDKFVNDLFDDFMNTEVENMVKSVTNGNNN
jgi:hypothetical protein